MPVSCPYTLYLGHPQPLGVSRRQELVNFAVYAKNASAVTLCLFEPKADKPLYELNLDSHKNRTGDIWHVAVQDLPEGFEYAYTSSGPNSIKKGHYYDPKNLLLDPYARFISTRQRWAEDEGTYAPRAIVCTESFFEWEDDHAPKIPMKDLIIYEMHVRGFTQSPTSGTSFPGTYLGIVEKLPYLKDLGVNAIELLPCQEFNELEYVRTNPLTGEKLVNYWGYSTVNFFAPMTRYADDPSPIGAVHEFKTLVKACHKEGMEVIIDVVFNHTAEGNELGPSLSFRGFDNSTYYMLNENGDFLNYSGCGNTFNCNHPVVRELIQDCLRYWVVEMHVDGFRFDLASILGRASNGAPLEFSPLIDAITHDPVLKDVKLIAEAWDAGGLYQVGSFYPEYGRWAEWNGCYRDGCRRFIKGTGDAAHFATKLSGSQDLYGYHRQPYHSINFITAHDGFTLRDLVSYNEKQNNANGEENRDGCNDNDSWNHGVEGESDDPNIQRLRLRQMKNFHAALMLSQGVPMLHMGDEYGHTKMGNNNTWCQDNALNWFDWSKFDDDFHRFYRAMIHFRLRHPICRRETFLSPGDVHWHGPDGLEKAWEDIHHFMGYTLKSPELGEDLFIAFYNGHEPTEIQFPSREDKKQWHVCINTCEESPNDFFDAGQEPLAKNPMALLPYSSLVLKAL